MLALPVLTWLRFLIWLDLGMVIYWFYGRKHSPLVNRAEAASRTAGQEIANFVTVLGGIAIFNAFALTLLGYMTEFGLTNETTAKWHEIGVTPDQADTLGLYALGASVLIFVIGKVLTRASGEK
jgi:hypothetical protein